MVSREEVRAGLLAHLKYLSVHLGERSIYQPLNLKAAEDYVFSKFKEWGYHPTRQSIVYMRQELNNIIAGDHNPRGYYILGAHMDTVSGSPGADDNASGVAVMLEAARLARAHSLPRPWTFIGFTLEEPPAYFTPYMGSRVYARRARQQRENLLGMLCLESVGYYRQEPESQDLPLALRLMGYPTTGNFIGLISDSRSRGLLQGLERSLKEGGRLPVVSLVVPLKGHFFLPETRLSDHANFWDEGYPAVMLTDTAFMRNPHYHGPGDVMENLDLEAMVELTLGLVNFVGSEQ